MSDRMSGTAARSSWAVPARYSARRMTRCFKAVYYSYVTATFAYTLYSTFYATGPAGYLMQLELDLFGRAELKITAMLLMLGWVFGFRLVVEIASKLIPSIVWIDGDLHPPGLQPNDGVRPLSWKKIMGISATPTLIGSIVLPCMYVISQQERQRPVYSIDLSSSAVDLPRDATFVEVTGVIARTHVVSFELTSDTLSVHEWYAPITEEGWTPNRPVRYVVYAKAEGHSDRDAVQPIDLLQSGIARIKGRIGGSLSTIAENGLRSRGVTLASPYVLITLESRDHTAFSWEDVAIYMGVAAFFSVFLLVGLARGRSVEGRARAIEARSGACER